ncbi:MAG: hypothetical protein J1E34_08255 [Oscillospiraceae bacterium]|nr:hypothetical protein [Oscillospiraceae bacterium]
MKKNKKQVSEKQNESQALRRRRLALSKIQESRKKQKTGAEQQKKAVFAKRLRAYPLKRAPETLRTKGYYRFTRDYPITVDENGLRENSPAKKRTAKKKAIWIISVLAVFLASFILAKTCVYLSSVEPETASGHEAEKKDEISSFLRISPGDIKSVGFEAVMAELQKYGCTGALIEIKDVSGKTYLGSETSETVNLLKDSGIKTAAYISCFKDSVSPDEDIAFRVRKNSSAGEIWKDNSGSGWLNPFSQQSKSYILNTVSAASKLGFDIIVLDNVCFPSDSGTSPPYYSGESDYNGTRNQLLMSFISDAVANAGSAQTAVLCSFSAFDPAAASDRAPYYGNLLETAAGILCADARISQQQKNVAIGSQKFADPSQIPYAFILSAGEYAAENSGLKTSFLCFDKTGNFENEHNAAVFSGVSGYIIW